MTIDVQEITEGPCNEESDKIKECPEFSVQEIPYILPLEIWEIIFFLLPMKERFICSRFIAEFGIFYQKLLQNYKKYFDSFRDLKTEQASHFGLNTFERRPFNFISNNQSALSISFSIYLSNTWVSWLDDNRNYFKFVTFEDENTNDKYLTYLRVHAISWLRFKIENIILPTNTYNLQYKIKGPCKDIRTVCMVSVRHKTNKSEIQGYLDLNHLQNIGVNWEWLPVHANVTCTKLLEVKFNFEELDELTVELCSLNEFWTRDLSFHMIRFVVVS